MLLYALMRATFFNMNDGEHAGNVETITQNIGTELQIKCLDADFQAIPSMRSPGNAWKPQNLSRFIKSKWCQKKENQLDRP